jgi:hypothetical protein
MEDQAVLMYCKDGIIYPVALTEQQQMIFKMTASLLSPLTVVGDRPLGRAVNLTPNKEG